ncbi:tripartite tricarboxylate transporter substrate binding protein [Falsiroseomonas sp.]|uniref:Bug family tripartite tricarboxylate transporter substrate binding protein n=1 Tax=Falsiroseomonas sp. TaxID=2870721 RepID=UPI002732F9A3|nr:tripartite tricarboxylate transporter substrate binding protein [Falsiroseomonas sp.]MDP3418964.1 tripartite tricarboxylate transporter substrate binding protein [Falsiroseomonas sp.]
MMPPRLSAAPGPTGPTRRLLLGTALAGLAAPARAQNPAWRPERPLRLIVGFAPGGTADLVARLAAAEMGKALGQNMIVENRPGASGNIATQAVMQAPADGHTMALAGLQLVTNPGLIAQLGYDPSRDLQMCGQLTALPVVVMASARSGITTIEEAIARAKGPGVTIGTAGVGTSSHLGAELLFRTVGGRFEGVQYRGGAPAFQALLSGDVEMMFDLVASYQAPAAAEGRVKILGVMQQNRAEGMPDVRSFGEAGLPVEAQMRSWQGICVRAGAPDAAIAALHAATVAAVQSPEFTTRMKALSIEPVASASPAAFDALYRAELGRWTSLIRDAGITVQ